MICLRCFHLSLADKFNMFCFARRISAGILARPLSFYHKILEDNVYQFLLFFDKLYDKFTDLEKKEFLNSFVQQVDIYEQGSRAKER